MPSLLTLAKKPIKMSPIERIITELEPKKSPSDERGTYTMYRQRRTIRVTQVQAERMEKRFVVSSLGLATEIPTNLPGVEPSNTIKRTTIVDAKNEKSKSVIHSKVSSETNYDTVFPDQSTSYHTQKQKTIQTLRVDYTIPKKDADAIVLYTPQQSTPAKIRPFTPRQNESRGTTIDRQESNVSRNRVALHLLG